MPLLSVFHISVWIPQAVKSHKVVLYMLVLLPFRVAYRNVRVFTVVLASTSVFLLKRLESHTCDHSCVLLFEKISGQTSCCVFPPISFQMKTCMLREESLGSEYISPFMKQGVTICSVHSCFAVLILMEYLWERGSINTQFYINLL